MEMKFGFLRQCLPALLILLPANSASAQQGNVSVSLQFAGRASCDVHPLIPFRIDNVPFRVSGNATMRPDGKASMDLTVADLIAPTRIRLNATLGAPPSRVPGGT